MRSEDSRVVLQFGDCSIGLEGNLLTAGNAGFRRTWQVAASGLLTPESFFDIVRGVEWLLNTGEAAPSPVGTLPDEPRRVILEAFEKTSSIEAESLIAELVAVGEQVTLRYRLQIFPDCRGVRLHLQTQGVADSVVVSTETRETGPTGIEVDSPTRTVEAPGSDLLESLTLAPLHLRLTQVILHDQTDRHNELVQEQEWLLHTAEHSLSLTGCLFYVEDVLTGAGLIFLKEAPLPHARPITTAQDLRVHPRDRRFQFTGHGADADSAGYAFITLAYDGGIAGRIAALQQYQRCLRPIVPGRDARFVSNTWGDRNRDGRIRADFMAQEIAAGARLGVDVIQIDDGWQVGATSNSVRAKEEGGVWEGFYSARDNFWDVHPERFPDGLESLVASAREQGMRFGLWFGPDSAEDFAHWERDAITLIRLHQDLGIDYIKIDGVKLRSKVGERNLRALFDRVQTETQGCMVFDLDVTAETRPGYFGMVGVGPLFVENRYTDWHRYWPHQTLRTLWQLAHHVDPARLRMEWLNHTRNTELYANDPLAPARYRPDYLFATVMFSSPLGWFEMSHLPESYFIEAAPLIAVWKEHRDSLFAGTVLPIGAAPDGVAWTGFLSIAQGGRSAYLLAFRELSPAATWQIPVLSFLTTPAEPRGFVRLGGEGTAELQEGGLRVQIPEAQRFFFGRLSL